MGYRRTLAVSL